MLMTERDGVKRPIDAFDKGKSKGAISQFRPRGSALGLVPLGPQWILVAVLIYVSLASARAANSQRAMAAVLILGFGALVVWQLMYHWRARIKVDPSDRTMAVRGRLITRIVHARDVRSVVQYGRPANQAVAYMDRHDRRLLTLRLVYWRLADIRRLNNELGVVLNEWDNPTVASPGLGLFPFLERHPGLVGVAMFLLLFLASIAAIVVSGWWSH